MIIALQYYVGFCHTSTLISHRYTYVPSFLNLPPTSQLYPTPLGCWKLCLNLLWSLSKTDWTLLMFSMWADRALSVCGIVGCCPEGRVDSVEAPSASCSPCSVVWLIKCVTSLCYLLCGTPLQCSCLENPRDGGAWWAAVYGVAQSWTRLKRLGSSSSSSSSSSKLTQERPAIKKKSLQRFYGMR